MPGSDTPPVLLGALPGAAAEPGAGPVEPALLDGLLDDAGPLGRHRDLITGDRRDLAAALLVPATAEATTALVEGLYPGDTGIRVMLAADSLDALRAARPPLLDVDAVELVGVRLGVPGAGGPDPAAAARDLLGDLDSSAPAWITVPPGEAAEPVLDVLVADGAEHATLDVCSGTPLEPARILRQLVDRDASFRVSGTPGVHARPGTPGPPGLLGVLCATRAALNGADPAELADILATRDPAPLLSALRRMSIADAAVLRAFLVAVEVPDAGTAAAELHALGLLPPADT